ncbi:MAG: GNAT family N-acetyltransferase [Candidatus Binatia bacterium]
MLTIVQAKESEELQAVRTLFKEYAASLNFELCFQNFNEELANLPGDYAPPEGCLLLALQDRELAGCVALRRQEDDICEMKRLYVRPTVRGLGIGKALAEAIIVEARGKGYKNMWLDTVPSMQEAQTLYESLGFQAIKSYRHNPICGTRFMELTL